MNSTKETRIVTDNCLFGIRPVRADDDSGARDNRSCPILDSAANGAVNGRLASHGCYGSRTYKGDQRHAQSHLEFLEFHWILQKLDRVKTTRGQTVFVYGHILR